MNLTKKNTLEKNKKLYQKLNIDEKMLVLAERLKKNCTC